MSGDGGLADPFPGADDRDRRQLERCELGRVETEVRADVRDTESENAAREREARDGIEHRLVGEIDDHLRSALHDRRLHVILQGNAVVLAAT